LEDVLRKPEIQENYSHTVGYFLRSSGRGNKWTPEYLETRRITGSTEFFNFLKDLDI
jgi:hypothetical protein